MILCAEEASHDSIELNFQQNYSNVPHSTIQILKNAIFKSYNNYKYELYNIQRYRYPSISLGKN